MVATHNVDFNTDPYCSRTTDSDTVLSSIQVLTNHLGLDVTITPGGNAGHSDLPGVCGSMVLKYTNMAPELKYPHGLQW